MILSEQQCSAITAGNKKNQIVYLPSGKKKKFEAFKPEHTSPQGISVVKTEDRITVLYKLSMCMVGDKSNMIDCFFCYIHSQIIS